MNKIVYVLNEKCIRNYEVQWHDTNVYHYRENALNKLKDIKEQNMMPIVEEESYKVFTDTSTKFEAGADGNKNRAYMCVEIIKTAILD